MKIVPIAEANLDEIVHVLRSGGLVIFPSETTYGVAVDACNPAAVARLTAYKQRPVGKPYSIAVSDIGMAENYVQINDTARNLYKNFLPGPVTIISKGLHKTAPGVESETGTLGIRIPDYSIILQIVNALGGPITATSANASYHKRPYQLSDIFDNLSDKQKALVDLAIDAGELPHNEPSTVIDTTLDDPAILRQGEVVLLDKKELLSTSEENTKNVGKELWQKYSEYLGKRPIIFALEGPMGAGKTHFTKGLGRAMGFNENDIVSPTYAFLEDHGVLQHIDAWRMETPAELASLHFEKMLSDKSIIVVEWADRVVDVLRTHREDAILVWVKISYGKKDTERLITWGVL